MDETDERRRPLDEIVERWWDEHFPGSLVAQVTESGTTHSPPRKS